MATLREYFFKQHNGLAVHHDLDCKLGGITVTLCERMVSVMPAGVNYMTYFVPEGAYSRALIEALLLRAVDAPSVFAAATQVSVAVHESNPEGEVIDPSDFALARRIHFYIDEVLPSGEKTEVLALATSKGFTATVQDRFYGEWLHDHETPWAFISHDSRDKDDFVRPLAEKLTSMLCPVWYDEYSLRVGQSLRESIDRGLKEARKCIVVLSPSFLSNDGWGAAEFNGAFGRHVASGGGIILPVWHGVTRQQVADYSTMIADVTGISSDKGVDEVARQLFLELQAHK